MLRKKTLIIILTVLLFGGFFGLTLAESANFSGSWQGTWTSIHGASGGLASSITQAGSVLSGTVDVRNTDCGDFLGLKLTGTVSGNIALFQASTVCPLDGSVNDLRFTSAVLSGNSMAGNYSLFSDGEPWDSGGFNLSRPSGQLIPRYRLYNPNNFHHHYTTDLNEYNTLGTIGWIQEGTSCRLYDGFFTIGAVETVPYYRLYNPNSFEHHWTTDANEYNVLGTIGWIQEGADGYVFASQVLGSEPLYRLYNPNDGLHHWTMDTNERTVLIGFGWIDEGIACYVFQLDTATGTAPTISSVKLFKVVDSVPNESLIFDIGDKVNVDILSHDPDLDMHICYVSQYLLPNLNSPFYPTFEMILPTQVGADMVYYLIEDDIVDGPAGDWRTCFWIFDKAGNESNEFCVNSVVNESPLSKTALLEGSWYFNYTIITTWEDYYYLDEIKESTTTPGDYNIFGEVKYGDLVVAGYSSDSEIWTLLDTGIIVASHELRSSHFMFSETHTSVSHFFI